MLPAIWKTDVFNSLLVEDENAWQMEMEGTKRSRKFKEPFLSVNLSPILKRNNDPAIDFFCNAIKKGIWLYDGIKFFEKEGIEIKTDRKIETRLNYYKRKTLSFPIMNVLYRVYKKFFKK